MCLGSLFYAGGGRICGGIVGRFSEGKKGKKGEGGRGRGRGTRVENGLGGFGGIERSKGQEQQRVVVKSAYC